MDNDPASLFYALLLILFRDFMKNSFKNTKKRPALSEQKRVEGFTLMEVLLVIGLIGIIAAAYFSATQFQEQSRALSGAVRNLTTDLRYAQQLSVTNQIDYGIEISTASDSYKLIRFSTTTVEFFDKDLPLGITFQSVSGFTSDEIKFNAYGAVAEAGTVTLVNTESSTTTIDVRPSGFVRIL